VPSKAKSSVAPLSEDAIRHRAYLMWEADGRPDGMAEHYWSMAALPAEMPVRPGKSMAAKAPKAKAEAKAPKLKAAAAKIAAPAVKAKPAAKAPTKKAAKKA
jgi:hypothetical protein